MIGKGNPLWPHAFYTRVGGPIKLNPGDFITATCRYYNNHTEHVGVGSSRGDEMCNLYLMYQIPFVDKHLDFLQCWGYRNDHGAPSQEKIPQEVNELCPYPGYAGPISEQAIADGWKMPQIPDESMNHHHGGGGADHHEHEHGTMKMGDHDHKDVDTDDQGRF